MAERRGLGQESDVDARGCRSGKERGRKTASSRSSPTSRRKVLTRTAGALIEKKVGLLGGLAACTELLKKNNLRDRDGERKQSCQESGIKSVGPADTKLMGRYVLRVIAHFSGQPGESKGRRAGNAH